MTRPRFEAALGFLLDPFQREALDALDEGRSVLVAAPTGSGKTVVAEYAIARALATGAKAFYTTPLKALSNQKFTDLGRIHGVDRVGLLTGDNSVNAEAPVVVMTTEVLRNMIYATSPLLDGLGVVVLDEVHYLQDRFRGPVWEEVIVHLPPEIELVCLSATVSNAEEVAEWIETVRGATTAVIEERRPVPLQHRYLYVERGADHPSLIETFVAHGDELRPNPAVTRLEARSTPPRRGPRRPVSALRAPRTVDVVDLLGSEGLLPSIVFVFSRAGCDQSVDRCRAAGLHLNTGDERRAVRRIADDHTRMLSDDELDVLGYGPWRDALEQGFAAHHAGVVPPMKEAIEEAFVAGLVKVVFATETLALGVNMPARSVVIEKLSKFNGERHVMLTPGEYTQLTGRAGRRGIDAAGDAIACANPFVSFEQVAGLAARRTDALTSAFRPTYNMAVNLVHRYSHAMAHHLLSLSFAQFRSDRDVVSLERQLERARDALARERERARSEHGDIEEYRALRRALEEQRRSEGRGRGVALETLRPGDVVEVGRRGGRLVVLGLEGGRGGSRVLALGPGRGVVRLRAEDFDRAPTTIGHIELPTPFAPRSPAFRRAALEQLRRVRARRSRDVAAIGSTIAEQLAAHPVARDPERELRVRASYAAERLEREVGRLERRTRARTGTLSRQLDQVLGLLEAWGYVEGWKLTGPGEMLARLYSEADLLLAEAIREGLLDGLREGELAALVSCCTYERRGPDGAGPMPPPRWPSREVATRVRSLERIWRDLVAAENDAGLPETRVPDPGFTLAVARWVQGDDLGDVLGDELTGGDFVRHVRQCADLLRQVADVAPSEPTVTTARRAAAACLRGVVSASSVVEGQ